MPFQMVDITSRVRIGQRRDGSFNLEVWDLPQRELDAEFVEIEIPQDAARALGEYFTLKG